MALVYSVVTRMEKPEKSSAKMFGGRVAGVTLLLAPALFTWAIDREAGV
jgi:hypothetical protein